MPHCKNVGRLNLDQQFWQVLLPPSVSVLDVELEPVLLSKAAMLGLPEPWVARLARLDAQRRQVS